MRRGVAWMMATCLDRECLRYCLLHGGTNRQLMLIIMSLCGGLLHADWR